jgi:hypothetical protein
VCLSDGRQDIDSYESAPCAMQENEHSGHQKMVLLSHGCNKILPQASQIHLHMSLTSCMSYPGGLGVRVE